MNSGEPAELEATLAEFGDYIKTETLTESLTLGDKKGEVSSEQKVGDVKVIIHVLKA